MKILVINGPNLNMLGIREPALYGSDTLEQINSFLQNSFLETNFEFFQSNFEGDIIEKIQKTDADGVIINAAGYTHYSVVIRDAILIRKDIPFIEVHLTEPQQREPFRRVSLLKDVCQNTFSGKQKYSYFEASEYLINLLKERA